MKKLMFVASLMVLSIFSVMASEDQLPDGGGCNNVPGANNGHCRSSTAGSGNVTYNCVDAYFFESNDCKK